MLWNLECPVGLSERKICAHLNEGNLDSLPKNKDLWSYVVKFEFNLYWRQEAYNTCNTECSWLEGYRLPNYRSQNSKLT